MRVDPTKPVTRHITSPSHKQSEKDFPIKSYPNTIGTGALVNETMEFHKNYQEPNYLVLNENYSAGFFGCLFDCLCIKFCFSLDKKFKSVNAEGSLDKTTSKILENLQNIDILVIPYDKQENFKEIIKRVKELNPELPIIIMCKSLDRGTNDDLIAEQLREAGYYAFSGEEALDKQQFISELIEHSLSATGVEKLKVK